MTQITREHVTFFGHLVADGRYNAVDEYQRIATKSAIYPGQGTPLGLIYVALKLNGESGELAEHVGKAMRDDDLISTGKAYFEDGRQPVNMHEFATLTPQRRDAIVKELGDVLWYVSAAANELGLSLSDVALANLRKLANRSERDALRGSGDNR